MEEKTTFRKICQHCGREFTAYTSVTAYCSTRCANLADKLKKRNERLRETQADVLESGFVGEASDALLTPLQSDKITMSGKDYTFYATIAPYANCIQDEWGMFFLQMSSWAYAPDVENEYGITGLPADLSIDVPIFTSRTNSGLDGSECALARIENGKITFTGKGQAGESKQYLYRGFMKFFYVREQEVSDENQA